MARPGQSGCAGGWGSGGRVAPSGPQRCERGESRDERRRQRYWRRWAGRSVPRAADPEGPCGGDALTDGRFDEAVDHQSRGAGGYQCGGPTVGVEEHGPDEQGALQGAVSLLHHGLGLVELQQPRGGRLPGREVGHQGLQAIAAGRFGQGGLIPPPAQGAPVSAQLGAEVGP